MQQAAPMPALFHIVTDALWQDAQAAGALRPASLAEEGFVHCSFAAQVPGTLQRHFPAPDGLLILTVDPTAVDAPIRVEDSYGSGQAFPHVYGPIPIAAVTGVRPAREVIDSGADVEAAVIEAAVIEAAVIEADRPDEPGPATADR
jgi:uncharacterized protein (DUF952 family)